MNDLQSIGDWIQLGILFVLVITALAIYKQYRLQNNLYKAQLLRDRFDMYWQSWEPVSDLQLRSFKEFPADWISADLYENSYSDNDRMIKRYIMIANLYEYLAFTHGLRGLGVSDLLGDHWLDKWTNSLIRQRVFLDVHRSYTGYYPDFEIFVDKLIAQHRKSIQD